MPPCNNASRNRFSIFLFFIGLTNFSNWHPTSEYAVAVPPHSEAWRARSGGETGRLLEPFRQRPTGLRRQFCYYASHRYFIVELLCTLNNPFRPTGSTLKLTLCQRTFGAFNEKAFR